MVEQRRDIKATAIQRRYNTMWQEICFTGGTASNKNN